MGSSRLIILDLETTGFNPKKDSIIEVYAGLYQNGKLVDEFHSLSKPKKGIPGKIIELTGITESMVFEAPLFKEISGDLYNFMKGNRILAYNSSFDKRFLVWNDRRFTCLRYQDYLKFIKKKRPNLRSYSLHSVAKHFGVHMIGKPHRAKTDVELVARLVKILGV
tara:strand:+ start:1563 stop:2057 length:495 start_codon:yes stop_codon:yes gene_type:complete